MLLVIAGSFYAYLVAWLLKLYYLGWLFALALALVATVGSSRWELRGLARAAVPVAVWNGYLALSTLWSPDPALTLYMLSGQSLCVMAFLLGYAWQRNLTPWQRSSYFLALVLTWLPFLAWMVATSGKLLDDSLGSVRTGFVAAGLSALPFLTWRARFRPSIGGWALITFVMVLLLASGSRSAPLLGVAALVASLSLVQRPGGWRKIRGFLIAASVTLLLVGLALIVPSVRNAVMSSVDKWTQQTSTKWESGDELMASQGEDRVDIERRLQAFVAIESFLAHPIRGAGYYSTLAITRDEYGLAVGAHGIITLLLGETGLIGVVLFGWLLLRFERLTRRALKSAPTVHARGFYETARLSMVVMLLFGMAHQMDQSPQFWVLLAWGYGSPASNDR